VGEGFGEGWGGGGEGGEDWEGILMWMTACDDLSEREDLDNDTPFSCWFGQKSARREMDRAGITGLSRGSNLQKQCKSNRYVQ
jgi:hypothetical protein